MIWEVNEIEQKFNWLLPNGFLRYKLAFWLQMLGLQFETIYINHDSVMGSNIIEEVYLSYTKDFLAVRYHDNFPLV